MIHSDSVCTVSYLISWSVCSFFSPLIFFSRILPFLKSKFLSGYLLTDYLQYTLIFFNFCRFRHNDVHVRAWWRHEPRLWCCRPAFSDMWFRRVWICRRNWARPDLQRAARRRPSRNISGTGQGSRWTHKCRGVPKRLQGDLQQCEEAAPV